MNEIKMNVKGMMCEGCENRIVNTIKIIDRVKEVTANHLDGTVIIKADNQIDKNVIKEKIESLDFEVLED